MSTNVPGLIKPGIGNVGSYQVSGIPWVSSSVAPANSGTPIVLSFPYITKFINIKNINASDVQLRVGFSENGVKGNNYFLLSPGESFEGELRVTDVYLLSNTADQVSFCAIVGLTGIERRELSTNWSGSAGVG